ncbi:hypothetical protein KDM87_04460 [Undibacterium sp. FT147W]|uniref:Uncharacterized protein n=1 Tax=Undibacterium rivi TaxID=2828729 RepID=A0ABS5H0C7_9BURK|nr:hypothetical protein [Undibacterium rivi]MBR7791839.1 hypothetical protein [Undibacterium rivi]
MDYCRSESLAAIEREWLAVFELEWMVGFYWNTHVAAIFFFKADCPKLADH